jgi:hypothetical protein
MCDPTVGGQVRQGHGAENGERCGYRAPFMKCGMPWVEDKQRAGEASQWQSSTQDACAASN